jgi:omega-6 fatty acid desaturase (delta-12 desaturase)
MLPKLSSLKPILRQFEHAQTDKALWQLINTLIPYSILWILMVYLYRINIGLVIPVALVASAFLIRIFILFHDCGHNSFLPSRKANRWLGFFLGLFTLTPSEHWWQAHAIHHATAGNLDKRGIGDVYTLTLQEYQNLSTSEKRKYRLFRSPYVMFLLGPIFVFMLRQRIPIPWMNRKAALSVFLCNLVLIGMLVVSYFSFGLGAFLWIQFLVLYFAGIAGIFLFYIQHQFPQVYWARNKEWDFVTAGLQGASYFALPRILQWVSGNIGFHHIHHLRPRIPNYQLHACYQSTPLLREYVKKITWQTSLQCIGLALYDENQRKLIHFPKENQPKAKV